MGSVGAGVPAGLGVAVACGTAVAADLGVAVAKGVGVAVGLAKNDVSTKLSKAASNVGMMELK